MISLRSAIQKAADTKQMPAFEPGSTSSLGLALGLNKPISVRNLIDTLDKLTAATVIHSSGELIANYVHGSAQIGLQSDGGGSFQGHVHESGVVGDNYLFLVSFVDAIDAAGKTLVFSHTGNVKGQLDIGKSDDDFQDDGFTQFVTDNWDTVKSSHVQFTLHVSTDPWQVTETVIAALIAVVGVAFGGSDAHNWTCTWRSTGPTLYCQRTGGGEG